MSELSEQDKPKLDSPLDLGQVVAMLRDDLAKILKDCEARLSAVRILEAHPAYRGTPEVKEASRGVVAALEADVAAVKRVLALVDTGFAHQALDTLPKTVAELLEAYLKEKAGPFTVQEATDSLRASGATGVTESAVAQALRRMDEGQVRQVKAGRGPNPAYYQRTESK